MAGAISYDAASRTATFNPQVPLAYATTYTAHLTTAVKDTSGEALPAEVAWTFTTRLDQMPPRTVFLIPASGAVNVPLNTSITAGWDQDLNPGTINPATFQVATAQGSPVSGAVTYANASRTATFTPSGSLAANTLYIATLKSGIQDMSGNATPGNLSFVFTTGYKPDDTVNFNGSFADAGRDTNGDGLYEQLIIRVGLHIPAAGNYALSATLQDAAGFRITSAASSANLQPGEQSMLLTFSGPAIGGHNQDGPYLLTKLLLSPASGNDAVRQEAYRTFGYAASQFPAALRFSSLPVIWVPPDQSLPAFNLRAYAHHATQSSDQLTYTILSNSDSRSGVNLQPDGSILVTPEAGWQGASDVTVQAAYGTDLAQATFRVNIGWPTQLYLPLTQKGVSLPALVRSNWQDALYDNFESSSFMWKAWSSISVPPGGWYSWAPRDCLAYSGTRSAWPMGGSPDGEKTPCGANYANTLTTTMLYTPPINLKYTSKADFSIKVWTDLEASDQVCVMVTNQFMPAGVPNEYLMGIAQKSL